MKTIRFTGKRLWDIYIVDFCALGPLSYWNLTEGSLMTEPARKRMKLDDDLKRTWLGFLGFPTGRYLRISMQSLREYGVASDSEDLL
ncbi:MAG TPA: hypothetical protein VK435_11475 [Thermodesulfovibrionales bacterium]|nr:hypothetical protein [Thermodesulfovibrionales bacterium]